MARGDCGDNTAVMRLVLVLALVPLVAAGCGQPQSPPKQAEALAAIASEGALLAADAAAGSTAGPFTRVHAQALRKEAEALRGAIRDRELAALAERVVAELTRLADAAGDRTVAESVARALEEAAGAAEERAP
jgi:hypothetical protein